MMNFRQSRRRSIKLTGQRSSSLDLARSRIVLLGAFFLMAYLGLAVRAFDLTVLRGEGPPQTPQAAMQSAAAETRADIVDRNGILLARTLPGTSLYADPHLISDIPGTAAALSRIFPDEDYAGLLETLKRPGRFIWLARRLTPEQQAAVLEIGEPGLGFRSQPWRYYPHGNLAAHLVGYAGVDVQGLSGVERQFDDRLKSGKPLRLALDVRLQHALQREIDAMIDTFEAKGGAGIIMDVNTGEILAGVSLPGFDPHAPDTATADARFNRLSLGVYELGSVFKIFSTALYLDITNAPMSTTFDAREALKEGRFSISDYHAEERILTLPEVFMHSSNIGSALMARETGDEALVNFYRDLGLLSPAAIELPEIGAPLIPRPWRPINTLTAAYGHGLATSPLQMVAAASAIVNGGTLVQPTVLADPEISPVRLNVISPQTAHRMRQLLRLVVTDGTGSKADVSGYRVGGKTGTAEKIVDGRYDRTRLLSSFIGFFPIESPRYAIYVMVDEPRGQPESYGYATGGWVAAPAVANVIRSMASILSIPPQRHRPAEELSASLRQFVSMEADDERL